MIEVNHLAKHFGTHQAVKDVSFQVQPGETLGFLGVNGAGKTTTMRVLTGFYPPTAGQAKVDGYDVFEEALKVRRKIGYLPEHVPLYPEMTVAAYLRFAAEVKDVPRSQRKAAVGRAMEDCRLEDVAGKLIKKLSKGYRQRVGLAQALVGDPEVLILDEPTIGLDPRQIIDIRELIRGFKGVKTIILSTHILPEVSMTCDRVAIINSGRVVAEDAAEALCAAMPGAGKLLLRMDGPADEVRAWLIGLPQVSSVADADGGGFLLEASGDVGAAVTRLACETGLSILEMTPQAPTLEEVFIRLVAADQEAPADV